MFSLFNKNEDPNVDSLDLNQFVFLDIEYISNEQHIVEISCRKFDNNKITLIYSSRINPFSEPDFRESIHARKKSKIPTRYLEMAPTLAIEWQKLSNLLGGKNIVHWGGSDFEHLNKAIKRSGRQEIVPLSVFDLMTQNGQQSLINAFEERFSAECELNNFDESGHCSKADTLMLALLYIKLMHNKNLANYYFNELVLLIKDKTEEAELFNEEQRQFKRISKANSKGEYSFLKLKIYFTGFASSEKAKYREQFKSIGFTLAGSASDPNIDYLVIPDSNYTSANIVRWKAEKPKKLMTIEEFIAFYPKLLK